VSLLNRFLIFWLIVFIHKDIETSERDGDYHSVFKSIGTEEDVQDVLKEMKRLHKSN